MPQAAGPAASAAVGPAASPAGQTAPAFEPGLGWQLNPNVALRPEPFGALAYHFGNRRLSFLKAPELVELVRGLGGHPRASDALAAVDPARRPAFLRALAALAASDMIVPRPGPAPDDCPAPTDRSPLP